MQIGRYQILEELGRGAMGVVYRAHDPQIDRDIALKILRQDTASSAEIIQRFLKEARAIGRLSHPNIVTVYDVGQDREDNIYIVEEFIKGQTLDRVMRENRLTLNQKVEIGIRLAEAVHYAHDKGIIHRDIKPPNVLLNSEGQVKIMDFGIAHMEDPAATQQTQAGMILGTPSYIAPELLSGEKVDGRADLYAIGIILYELVTGCRPFQGATMTELFRAIIQDEPKPPSALNADLPESLSQVILKCLHKKPGARFQTGDILARALAECLGKDNTGIQAAPPLAAPSRGRRAIVRGLAALAILSAVGGTAYFLLPDLAHRFDKEQAAPIALLQVSSEPQGADLYIMGDYKGRTPMDVSMPLGDYRVRLTMDGYYDWQRDVHLKQAGEIPLSAEMKPILF